MINFVDLVLHTADTFGVKKANINRLPERIQARPVAHDGRRSMHNAGYQ